MLFKVVSFLGVFVSATHVLSQGIQWVVPSGRNFPPHSWVGAETQNRSEKYYICQGRIQESMVCGKTNQTIGADKCMMSYNDHVFKEKSERILTLPLWVPHTFQWVSGYTYGRVPPNSVECGDMTYIGRYLNGSHVVLGKVDSLNQAFFYADAGGRRERYLKNEYEVLIRKDM